MDNVITNQATQRHFRVSPHLTSLLGSSSLQGIVRERPLLLLRSSVPNFQISKFFFRISLIIHYQLSIIN